MSYSDNSTPTSFKRIIGVHGEAGIDGPGYETIYIRTATVDSVVAVPESADADEYIPVGWTDNPKGTTAALQCE